MIGNAVIIVLTLAAVGRLRFVTECESELELHIIQDPGSRLRPKAAVKIVRYMVARND